MEFFRTNHVFISAEDDSNVRELILLLVNTDGFNILPSYCEFH